MTTKQVREKNSQEVERRRVSKVLREMELQTARQAAYEAALARAVELQAEHPVISTKLPEIEDQSGELHFVEIKYARPRWRKERTKSGMLRDLESKPLSPFQHFVQRFLRRTE